MNKTLLALSAAAAAGLAILTLSPAPAQAHAGHYHAPPPPASYHRPNFNRAKHRPHFYLGGDLVGQVVLGQVVEEPDAAYFGHGGGFGLHAGFRLNPWVSLEGSWKLTFHDERWPSGGVDVNAIYMNMFTADLKIHVPTRGRVEPFLQGGVGVAVVGATFDEQSNHQLSPVLGSGVTFNVGGGLDLWVSPNFTIGGRVMYRGVALGPPEHNDRWTNFLNLVEVQGSAAFHF